MRKKAGFTLVELMVVVAIIAILAAVALPMYSSFRQKARVSMGFKGLSGVSTALIAHYNEYGSFLVHPITLHPTGAMTFEKDGNVINIGSALSGVENITWSLDPAPTDDEFNVKMTFTPGTGCPTDICDTVWTLTCSTFSEICRVNAVVGVNDPLGLSF